MVDEKRNRNVSVWISDSELRGLDEARKRAVRGLPGAQLSRSAYLAELLRKDLAEQAKAAEPACGG